MKNNLHKKFSFGLLISSLLFTSTQISFVEAKSAVKIEGFVDKVDSQSMMMTIEVSKIGDESVKTGESSPQFTVDLTSARFFKEIRSKNIPLTINDLHSSDMIFLKGMVNGKTIKATEVIVAVPLARNGEEIDPRVLSEQASSSRLVGTVVEVKGDSLKVLDFARRNIQNDTSKAVVQIDISKATVERHGILNKNGMPMENRVSSSSDILVGDMVSSAGSFVNGVMVSTDTIVVSPLPHLKEHEFKESEVSVANTGPKQNNESTFQKTKKWLSVKIRNLFSW